MASHIFWLETQGLDFSGLLWKWQGNEENVGKLLVSKNKTEIEVVKLLLVYDR